MTEASLDMAPKLSESGEKGVKATEQIYRCKECSTRIVSLQTDNPRGEHVSMPTRS